MSYRGIDTGYGKIVRCCQNDDGVFAETDTKNYVRETMNGLSWVIIPKEEFQSEMQKTLGDLSAAFTGSIADMFRSMKDSFK